MENNKDQIYEILIKELDFLIDIGINESIVNDVIVHAVDLVFMDKDSKRFLLK